ncbi:MULTISPECIES: hypothetical protein [Streptomyces]|nr:hypothetical protein [Streptomyces adustus]
MSRSRSTLVVEVPTRLAGFRIDQYVVRSAASSGRVSVMAQ